MLKTIVFGNIGNDAEIRSINATMSVISFSVAHSEKWTNPQGEQQERTTWVRCSLWRKPESVKIANYLRKGTKVLVEGQPSASAWIGNDGTAQASLELRVTNIELGGSSAQNTTPISHAPQPYQPQGQQPVQARPNYTSSNDEDDLPF
jgi:single-strand DNA-binding protein